MSAVRPIAPEAARVLADALSYPVAGLVARVRAGSAALPPAAADALLRLADRLDALGPAGAEELYTATFDLRPAVSPYAGHHLCGEGPRRHALLAWLAALRAATGVAAAEELPDHLAELLRWLAAAGDHPDAPEVAALALAPAARRALDALPGENPYRDALAAVLAALAPALERSGAEEVVP